MPRKIPSASDAAAELQDALARAAGAETPAARGELFGYKDGSEEQKAVRALVAHEKLAGHERGRREALDIVPAAPSADYNMLPAIEGRIRRGEDWRDYSWGREVVWDLLRRGVAHLAESAEERESILAAIVAEVASTVRWEDRQTKRGELDKLPPARLLEELLLAFGLTSAPGFSRWSEMVRGSDPRDALRTLRRADTAPLRPSAAHLAVAESLLRQLVRRVRALREVPAPTVRASDYEKKWEAIRAEWCSTVTRRRWVTLPLLCVDCGRPILLRAHCRLGTGADERATACSETCRLRAKSRVKQAALRASRK
ncbi:MAG: hypothetical protein ACYDCL_13705 [Myxococcales bacterium]